MQSGTGSTPSAPARLRVGCVSYLNSKPLIDGLESDPLIDLQLRVPAALLSGLENHELDVALLPVIDYQRLAGLRIIPSAGIGSNGETLTVRIFSKRPIAQIESLACDIESHTSVALARVLLAEVYNRKPEFSSFALSESRDPDAMVLIGDKVVCQEPKNMPFQLDLGAAWKDHTGLPFVFAVWVAVDRIELGDLPERLKAAKERGMGKLPEIVTKFAEPRGWPRALAIQYLSSNLKFDIGPAELEAIRLFYRLAHKHNLIAEPRALEIYDENLSQRR